MNDINFLHRNFDKDLKVKIIIVEDDLLLGISLKKFLEESLSLTVQLYRSSEDCLINFAKDHSKQEPFVLIADISLGSGSDGLLLVDILKEKGFAFVSIVMTGFASIETAIKATKKGVYHYLTKPFELDVIKDLLVRAVKEKLNLVLQENREEQCKGKEREQGGIAPNIVKLEIPQREDFFYGMLGRSAVMKEVFKKIEKVACSDATVLITGDSGTGKELVAQAVHDLSFRSKRSKTQVNCGAIPGELLESELFGHVKGSFSGAIANRVGRFEYAHGGTIFLDEIGDLSLHLQVKLLRVLQLKIIEPVGLNEAKKVDVRVIAATHQNLEKKVQEGLFRQDLFYRLNIVPIKIPALKERREDIPFLISYFLGKFVSADRSNEITFTSETLDLLIAYDWPGNVRELENVIERLVILRGGHTILPEELPAKIYRTNPLTTNHYKDIFELPEKGVDLKKILSDIEDSLINQALGRTGGNKNQASKLLSLNRTTLIEKLKKKGFSLGSSPN